MGPSLFLFGFSPYPLSPVNHSIEEFPDDPKAVTFIGHPFPLSEAHEHFSRLRKWGLTFSACLFMP